MEAADRAHSVGQEMKRAARLLKDAPRVGRLTARSLVRATRLHPSTACRISRTCSGRWRSELADGALHPIARATAILRGHAVVVCSLCLGVVPVFTSVV